MPEEPMPGLDETFYPDTEQVEKLLALISADTEEWEKQLALTSAGKRTVVRR